MSALSSISSPTSSTTSSTASSNGTTSSTPGTSAASVQSQYNEFLSMLTTELQNQDPTQPVDSTQFVSQLAQFSQLEQSLQTNSSLQSLISLQQSSAVNSSLGYIGHTVEASGNQISVDGTGDPATLAYSLPSTAASATVTVANSNGATVQQFSVDPSAGQHNFSFDTLDASGSNLPAGTYTFQVTASDSSGNAIAATTYDAGKVTGVFTNSGTVELEVGGLQIPASQVIQITA